ncbi:response regulator [Massilia forsythiae]|uniref:histidine kinase n=1 Tax=Massilia forsythiae TaxID=2728020 RepID=A0A7Z2W035_9BURK|nr:ATP-binding protein [Massilia forsythiae]QJE02279.1 response regulator [Massilia forsythiae]
MSTLGHGRILFLCDRAAPDPAVGAVAAELGCELVRAHSLDAALRHAEASPFALVLAGYSGDAAAMFRSVRALRACLPQTPLIVHGIPRDPPFTLESVYEAGALALLHDPVSAPILKSKAGFFLDSYHNAAARRRTAVALEETRARLEATIANADVALWTWDVRHDRVGADARMAELFGLDPARREGAPLALVFAAVHPSDRTSAQALLQRALESGAPYEATFRVRRAGGDWRWVLARGRFEGAAGGPSRLNAVAIDVTLRKQAEERLQASEERYRTLFDSLDTGVCVIEMLYDAGGRPYDYRFLETNPAFGLHSGLSDVVGKTMLALNPQHEAHWFETYGRVAASGEPVRFVDHAAGLDDRWFDVYATRVGAAGSHKVVVLFTDISARRRNEEQLRRLADDLAEQDRLKTEFLATLAHELRNPLAPIRSGLQLMRRTQSDPATLARVQDIMDRQLDQLVHLVDDLLDVARITRGQVELKPGPVDLGELLQAAVETSMPLIEAARHRLDVRLPGEALPLFADRTRITQVVSNLLNNAAKYTPRGGSIVLSAERDGDQAVIAVADDGIGIPAESLDDVFKMFTQVPEHARQAPGGLGIGLSLVRSLLQLHGGSISAASGGHNAGSVFTVRLPLAGAPGVAAAGLAGATGPAPPSPGRRLLVVDDNRDAAETLSALLATMGHEVAVANDGVQALRMMAGLRPQVVFLDIGMPGMSGYEVARAVREDPALDGVRLVALTGWGGEADRTRTGEAGFDRHLTKPATLDALSAALAALAAPPSPVQR